MSEKQFKQAFTDNYNKLIVLYPQFPPALQERIRQENLEIASVDEPQFFIKRLTFYYLLRNLTTKPVVSGLLNDVYQYLKLEQQPLSLTKPGREFLSSFYQTTFNAQQKRKRGQVWTPQPIAEFMANWLEKTSPALVCDPALGSGGLISEIKQARTTGDEIDELLFLLLQVSYARKSFTYESFLKSNKKYPAIICNPPYTRHQDIPGEEKARLQEMIFNELGIKPNGFTSLYAYFFLHALSRITSNGRLAFITPTELYDSNYGKIIRKYLAQQHWLEGLLYFSKDSQAFPGVAVSGVISLINKAHSSPSTSVVEIKKWPGSKTLLKYLDTPGEYSWGVVEKRLLNPRKKWLVDNTPVTSNEIQLKEIAQTSRGIATGNNKFFVLDDQQVKELAIPKKYLQPVVRRTKHVEKLLFTSQDFKQLSGAKWLLYCHEEFSALPKPIQNYITYGEQQGFDKTALVALRKHWFQVEKRQPPHFVYTYLSNGYPRFVLNQGKALNLNTLHSVTIKQATLDTLTKRASKQEALEAIAMILNSSTVLSNLNQVGRSYGNGTLKVEPKELAEVRIFDVNKLTSPQIKQLSKLFHKLNHLTPKQVLAEKDSLDNYLAKIF